MRSLVEPLAAAIWVVGELSADGTRVKVVTADDWHRFGPQAGFASVVPMASSDSLFWGIRARHGCALINGPVVMGSGRTGELLTLSSHRSTLVPNALLLGLYGRSGSVWTAAAERDDLWELLGEAHVGLGGEETVLQALRGQLRESMLRETGTAEASPKRYRTEWPLHAADVLGSTPFAALLRLFSKVADREARTVDEEALGPLVRRGQILATQNAMRAGAAVVDDTSLLHLCRAIVQGPMGEEGDLFRPMVRSRLAGHERTGKGPAWMAARQLLQRFPDQLMTDPLVHASRVMLAAGPSVYTGQAHLDAAVECHAQGDFEGAVASLQTAAFFQAARFGTVPGEMLEAQAKLFTEVGAVAHQQALVAGLRQELP